MNWFKRYGIPGAYFVVCLMTWLYAFGFVWPRGLDSSTLIALGVIILPIGYILSVCGHLLYLLVPGFGLHRRGAELAGIDHGYMKSESAMESIFCIRVSEMVMQDKHDANATEGTEGDKAKKNTDDGNAKKNGEGDKAKKNGEGEKAKKSGEDDKAINNGESLRGDNKAFMEAQRFFQDWARKRVDVMAINLTIILATMLAPFIAMGIKCVLTKSTAQSKCCLIIILILISFLLACLLWKVWRRLYKQVAGAIGGHLILGVFFALVIALGIKCFLIKSTTQPKCCLILILILLSFLLVCLLWKVWRRLYKQVAGAIGGHLRLMGMEGVLKELEISEIYKGLF